MGQRPHQLRTAAVVRCPRSVGVTGVQRERLRCQQRARSQQLGRQGFRDGQPGHGPVQLRGQGARIVERRAVADRRVGVEFQLLQVLVRGEEIEGLPGLSQREGQIVQGGGQATRVLVTQLRTAQAEKIHRLGAVQDADLDRRGDLVPERVPGSDQYMPLAGRQMPGEVGRVYGVVEDDQPARPGAQVVEERLYRLLLGGLGGGTVDEPCERGQLRRDLPVGLHPPHQLVLPAEPVRVLDGQLGLAHPDPSAEGQHGCRA